MVWSLCSSVRRPFSRKADSSALLQLTVIGHHLSTETAQLLAAQESLKEPESATTQSHLTAELTASEIVWKPLPVRGTLVQVNGCM